MLLSNILLGTRKDTTKAFSIFSGSPHGTHIFGVPFTDAALVCWCFSCIRWRGDVHSNWHVTKQGLARDRSLLPLLSWLCPCWHCPGCSCLSPKSGPSAGSSPACACQGPTCVPCCRAAPNHYGTNLSHCTPLFFVRCRTWKLSTWYFQRFLCWPTSTASLGLSGWWPCPQGYQLVTQTWCHLQIWIQCRTGPRIFHLLVAFRYRMSFNQLLSVIINPPFYTSSSRPIKTIMF